MEIEKLIADRMAFMGTNAIREILKVVSQPGMVSLAGGIPAPESFPLEILKDLIGVVFHKYAQRAFQYDLSEGFPPLRAALTDYLSRQRGISAPEDAILVASGSQGVLDAIGKVFISTGDVVAVESPTYLGALQAFNPYRPRYISLETDENGLVPDSLDYVLEAGKVKFVYLVPTFQNPTGRTLPLQRRIAIADILKRHDALLIEDDPYSLLRYRGDDLPPIQTLAPGNVVYIGTLSKVFAPGLRVGFCVAPESARKWLVMVKQGVDLHTSTFNQALAAEYITGGHLDRHLPEIIDIYAPRQAAMLNAFEKYFPGDFRWSKPEGGMFIWAQGPEGLDMTHVYRKAVERKVAFVPGTFFFAAEGDGIETARFNFTMADEVTIDASAAVLADVFREEIAALHRGS